MERSKQKRWKKVGGGSFRMNDGRIIKQNQVFQADIEDIPDAFRDTILSVDEKGGVSKYIPKPQELPTDLKVEKNEYEMKERESGSWFDIFNQNGKQMNAKALRKSDAEKMLKDLSDIED